MNSARLFVVECWESLMNSNHNPLRHLNLAGQHYLMQVLGWMWSMVFSLAFLSIYQFGLVWMAHLFLIGGAAMTVALFREAEKVSRAQEQALVPLSRSSRCVWKLDSEA